MSMGRHESTYEMHDLSISDFIYDKIWDLRETIESFYIITDIDIYWSAT